MNISKQQAKIVVLSSLGGMLEFYDFVIFAVFAIAIGQSFFPNDNDLVSTMAAFATFAVGYLARPIGGIIFSHFGDKYGRKISFISSIAIMAIATILMALLPTYAIAGISMPIIFILLRILQGFAVGGEIPGSVTYVTEHVRNRPGFACGIVFLFINLGIFLADGVHAFLSSFLSPDMLINYGWRIAFLFGGFFAILSYFLRTRMQESPEFIEMQGSQEKIPISTLFKKYKKEIMLGSFMVALPATIISIVFLYATSYMTLTQKYLPAQIAYITLITLFSFSGFILLWGVLSDYFGHKKVFIISAILLFFTSYFFFYALSSGVCALMIYIFFSLICGMSLGSIYPILAFIFPTKVRYSGVAFCYNIAFAIFGGLTPLLATYLISAYGIEAPALVLMAVSIFSVIGAIFVSEPKMIKH